MQHISGGPGLKAEPNLTPLLDMVLQLLMFFMMCVNFVTEQVNETIQLPVSQSARPMDKRETDVLYLNLNKDGKLEVPGREQPLATVVDMRVYLRTQHADAERAAKEKDGSTDVKTTIIIRADKAVEYKDVYQLLRMCKDVGYRKFQVRAMTKVASKQNQG
jgi:biopolymer transport protein ExbD